MFVTWASRDCAPHRSKLFPILLNLPPFPIRQNGRPTNMSSKRKPSDKNGGGCQSHVFGEFAQSSSNSEIASRRGGAFEFTYPATDLSCECDDVDRSTFLISCSHDVTPIKAFIDSSPCFYPQVEIPSYECDPLVVGNAGLGFHSVEEELGLEAATKSLESICGVGLGFRHPQENENNDKPQEQDGEELLGFDSFSTPQTKKEMKMKGFLSIGGVKVYMEDSSSPEEEYELYEEDENDDDEDKYLHVEDGMIGSTAESSQDCVEEDEEDSSSDGDSLSSDDSSDIDDEVARDYIVGIGVENKLSSTNWLENSFDEDGLLKNGGSCGKGGTKLGGMALMNASVKFGIKKPKSKKSKGNERQNMTGSPSTNIGAPTIDDILFFKDSRAALRKNKSSHMSRSLPHEVAKRSNDFSVGKKKHRKELIVVKRRQRMINRGFDLDQINYKFRQMVVNEHDILSFQPMHTRDCSQVQRLASIYNLKSDFHGSGKKRFVTVSRTEKTSLPSTKDKVRLDKLLGAGLDVDDFSVSQGPDSKPLRQIKSKGYSTRDQQSAPTKLSKKGEVLNGKRFGKQKSTSYAVRPVSFVSYGVMQADPAVIDSNASTSYEMVTNGDPSIGAFEVHTKGFGSKMLAKMGFVEGTGLGKEGKGMVRPIEVIQRPKSLGLGVQFEAETSSVRSDTHTKIGSFEKHTKGFGSRMMTKMGFVPGTGLGKDGQGIVNPLTAVKRPKSRGLGGKT